MTSSTFHRFSSSAPALRVAYTTRRDGDFHPRNVDTATLRRRRSAVVDLPWTVLDQCHGTRIVEVDAPGQHDGERADAAISSATDLALAVWAADCAPVVLIGAERWFGVLHAGWRGLAAGIIGAVAESVPEPLVGAVVGPTIGPCCYEFGVDDAARVASGIGCRPCDIEHRQPDGSIRLDMVAAIRHALEEFHVVPTSIGGCTGCDREQFSHRVRADPERHVMVAWQECADTEAQ